MRCTLLARMPGTSPATAGSGDHPGPDADRPRRRGPARDSSAAPSRQRSRSGSSITASCSSASTRPAAAAASRLRAILADGPAPTRSELEDVVLDLILRGGLPGPDVNVPLILGGRRVIPDFRWPDRQLVVEADGAAWHDDPLARDADAERQALLEAHGERVLRGDLVPGRSAAPPRRSPGSRAATPSRRAGDGAGTGAAARRARLKIVPVGLVLAGRLLVLVVRERAYAAELVGVVADVAAWRPLLLLALHARTIRQSATA